MTEQKRYGHPQFGHTLEELKALAPHAQTVDGIQFDGPARKVGSILTLSASAGERDRLRALIAECAEYLNTDRETTIGSGSILHRQMIAAMAAKEA